MARDRYSVEAWVQVITQHQHQHPHPHPARSRIGHARIPTAIIVRPGRAMQPRSRLDESVTIGSARVFDRMGRDLDEVSYKEILAEIISQSQVRQLSDLEAGPFWTATHSNSESDLGS